VELRPTKANSFTYLPGQFALFSFRSSGISTEPHPFTLASTPSRGGTLQIIIGRKGDWTGNTQNLEIGDRALIQGPFGRFCHMFAPRDREMIMIAGGIGITPMLSMLRFMADRRDPRPITLIWSSRTREQMVFHDEIHALTSPLTGLRLIPIITRNTARGARNQRLNRSALETMLTGCSPQSAVFICGPSGMMAQIRTDLKKIGFPTGRIYREDFGF
jgi:predicted ferric reductase